jgi:chemotaxis signal transduction protein
VPQNCLAEIVTLHTDAPLPPEVVTWRDRAVPVLDFGGDDGSSWQQTSRDAGLVAIFLGLKGEGCEYWGVAIRGEGLRIVGLKPEEVQDAPEEAREHATAAFRFNERLCQVPDLDSFQKKLAANQMVA